MNYKKVKFNLVKALRGAEVVTRNGNMVKIICHKEDGKQEKQRLAGWVDDDFLTWWDDGKFSFDRSESIYDLFILEPNDNIGFINIHEDSHGRWADERIYDFHKVAVENGKLSDTYKGTIEIVCP